MPTVYSVQSYGEKPKFVSSLTVATSIARDLTAPSKGGNGDAIIRVHETPKANMEAILSALNGDGWATLETAPVVKTMRNGRST
jgi:hypothetical protein